MDGKLKVVSFIFMQILAVYVNAVNQVHSHDYLKEQTSSNALVIYGLYHFRMNWYGWATHFAISLKYH